MQKILKKEMIHRYVIMSEINIWSRAALTV